MRGRDSSSERTGGPVRRRARLPQLSPVLLQAGTAEAIPLWKSRTNDSVRGSSQRYLPCLRSVELQDIGRQVDGEILVLAFKIKRIHRFLKARNQLRRGLPAPSIN